MSAHSVPAAAAASSRVPIAAGPNQPGSRRGVAAYALDPAAAARLWQVSVDTLAGQAG